MYSLRHDISAGLQNTAYMSHTFFIWNTIESYEYAGFLVNPFKRQIRKMVNAALADELFECVWPFCGGDAY